MNLTISALSTMPAIARKRPRTQTLMFDLPCTSALSSLPAARQSSVAAIDEALSAQELFVTSSPIDKALAALDVSLGLVCSSTTILPTNSNITRTDAKRIPIVQELDQVLAAVREERERELVADEIPDDSSCVSGSGSLAKRVVAKVEDSSATLDVLYELQALDSHACITVMSAPLVKSNYKRRRRR